MSDKIRNHYLKVGVNTFDLKNLDLSKMDFKKPFENLIFESMLSSCKSICDLDEATNSLELGYFLEKLKFISGLEEPKGDSFYKFFNLFIDFCKNFNYDTFTWHEIELAATSNLMPSVNTLGGEIPIIIEKRVQHTTLEFLSLILAKYALRKNALISKLENEARKNL